MKAHWTSRLGDIAVNQMPYAIAQALNDTAREAAAEARVEAGKRLNIKRKAMLNAFIRNPNESRATKQRHVARVLVAGPRSDPARGYLLAQHEQDGYKVPEMGKRVAVPGKAIRKPGLKRDVIRGTELKNFQPFTRKGKRLVGQKNTFFVTSKSGLPLLLQRQARQVRVVWLFVKRSRLTAKLGFTKSVNRTVRRNLQANIGRSLTRAIASAKQVTAGGGVTSSRL